MTDTSNAPLPPDVWVLRVLRAGSIHLPAGAVTPTWEAFSPTTADKAHAQETGTPVLVSVWDSRKTTPEQAIAFRGGVDDLCVFRLLVGDIDAVGASCDNNRMRVMPDPEGVPASARSLPGADGHAGIEGLDRPKDMSKIIWKNTLTMLAEKCKPCLPA